MTKYAHLIMWTYPVWVLFYCASLYALMPLGITLIIALVLYIRAERVKRAAILKPEVVTVEEQFEYILDKVQRQPVEVQRTHLDKVSRILNTMR